jgi:hypothetical protein
MNMVIIDIPCQCFTENVSKHSGDQLDTGDSFFSTLLEEKGVR